MMPPLDLSLRQGLEIRPTASALPPSPSRRALLTSLPALTAIPALPLGLGACAQSLFFHPNRRVYLSREQAEALAGVPIEVLEIPNRQGHRLHAAWLPAHGPTHSPARGTVVQVHGNAANLTNHLPLVTWLPAQGYQVLAFDYQGYGASEGRPSLQGVVDDTIDMLDWVWARPDVQTAGPLIVLGQSLGGATALRAVSLRPKGVTMLVLDSPFSSYRGVAIDVAQRLPWWLRWMRPLVTLDLPSPRDDPLTALPQWHKPLVVIVGTADTVIPPDHGRTLWQAARAPKLLVEVLDGQHIDALQRPAVQALLLQTWAQGLAQMSAQKIHTQ